MPSPGSERRLAAIMFTDIVGYTALMAESEAKGLRVRTKHRQVVRPLVERYHGEWVESPGDHTLSTFPSWRACSWSPSSCPSWWSLR